MQQREPNVAYWELHGRLERGVPRPPGRDVVVLSNLEQGNESSPGARGLCVRFVARGRETYRIGGRAYSIDAGQVMIAPHDLGADCEIRRVERTGTLGICTLIHGASLDLDWAFGPLVAGADCTSVGPLLRDTARALWVGRKPKDGLAQHLVASLCFELPNVADAIATQAAKAQASKPATRFEMVRRAHLAQAYLHASVDRAVDLQELAGVVGISPFRLLAAFQHCFGDTPASYHRKLRLSLALDAAKRRALPISAIAEAFGFSGASSFSHAYRRAFGRAPVWSKAAAVNPRS